MKYFFTFVFLSAALYSFSQADKQQHLEFVSPEGKPVITPDGNHTLYNSNKQKVKEGLFKDGRLYDGYNYSYDKEGALLSISIYKGGRYKGDSTLVDTKAKNKRSKEK
jgi:hypothetical protein